MINSAEAAETEGERNHHGGKDNRYLSCADDFAGGDH